MYTIVKTTKDSTEYIQEYLNMQRMLFIMSS